MPKINLKKTKPTRMTYTELPIELVEALERIAEQNDRSRSKQIKVALEEWIKQHRFKLADAAKA